MDSELEITYCIMCYDKCEVFASCGCCVHKNCFKNNYCINCGHFAYFKSANIFFDNIDFQKDRTIIYTIGKAGCGIKIKEEKK